MKGKTWKGYRNEDIRRIIWHLEQRLCGEIAGNREQ
jgi:hypothetical protein